MIYRFYYDSFGKKVEEIPAQSFREARTIFFNRHKMVKHIYLEAVWECDDSGCMVRRIA